MTVFKDLFPAYKLELAAMATLEKWMPTYLREIERQLDMDVGKVPPPKNYGTRNRFEVLAVEALPRVVVISPGLVSAPRANGNGDYTAEWSLAVGIAAAAPSEEEADMLAKIYGLAARGIIAQNPSLGDVANRVEWVDERYDDLPIESSAILVKVAAVFFTVEVVNVLSRWAGPDSPDEEPYVWGVANTVDINIIKEPVNG